MTRLILVRHGETVDNVNQIMQGQTQGLLTERGVAQAQEVARNMANEKIDAFVSSDLKRSYDTCVIIAKPHRKDVVTTHLLRERDWGDFTGQFIPDLKGKAWPPNVESLKDLKERASDFLNFIKDNFPQQTVLAVGHGIINKAVQAVHFHKEMHEVQKMANADIRYLEL